MITCSSVATGDAFANFEKSLKENLNFRFSATGGIQVNYYPEGTQGVNPDTSSSQGHITPEVTTPAVGAATR